MSPASYRAAPPRVGLLTLAQPGGRLQNGLRVSLVTSSAARAGCRADGGGGAGAGRRRAGWVCRWGGRVGGLLSVLELAHGGVEGAQRLTVFREVAGLLSGLHV